jgi:hypothetical protein
VSQPPAYLLIMVVTAEESRQASWSSKLQVKVSLLGHLGHAAE